VLRGPSHVARVSSTMATQMPFMASATRGEGSYWDLRGQRVCFVLVLLCVCVGGCQGKDMYGSHRRGGGWQGSKVCSKHMRKHTSALM
jgi:hypothetical protein